MKYIGHYFILGGRNEVTLYWKPKETRKGEERIFNRAVKDREVEKLITAK
jgi:hypothetical protein